MITVAGAIVGIALTRFAGQREAWLRAAILAQIADLVTFAAVWEHNHGELNPIGLLVRDASNLVFGEYSGAGTWIAWLVLSALKLGLLAFLTRVDPLLGRYRRLVMAVGIAAGTLGAASNVIAYPNSAGSLLVVGLFAVVAIRAPARFGDLARLAAGVSGTILLGLFGLLAITSIPYASYSEICVAVGCPPGLTSAITLLGTVLIAAAMLGVWYTLRFSFRLRRRAATHAD